MSLHRRLRQPRHRRQPRHFRQFAAALGSLGLASTLAFSGLVSDGIETTEAAWNDTEKATAEVKAVWADGGWARSSTNAYTNYASYWDRTSSGSPVNATETRINTLTSPGAQSNTHGEKDMNANFEITTPYTVFPL